MSIFRFRYFSIQQSNAALKVGTDSMLLGSLCYWKKPERLLDIGTGTGVLALMCSQRFPFQEIIGLDISEEAIRDAKHNAENSPFPAPVSIAQIALQDFQSNQLFDAIISNPPYFENSYKNEKEDLRLARHTDSLSFEELIRNIARLLSETGLAWMIVPVAAEKSIETLSTKHRLFVKQKINLEGKPGKHVRTIYCLTKQEVTIEISSFTIRTEHGEYSEEYKELTKDFHDREL